MELPLRVTLTLATLTVLYSATALPVKDSVSVIELHVPTDGVKDQPCDLCKTIIDGVKKEVKNGTKEAYEKALDAICDKQPSPYKEECKQYMEMYRGKIADMLVKGEDAQTICKNLGVCTAYQLATGVQLDPCSLCKTAIGGVKKEVKSKSKEAYEKALEAICNSKQVPSQYKANCKQLMDRYKGQIADWLMEGKDAETICKALGACTAVQVDTGVQLDPCSLCKTAIDGVKKEVKSKSKEAYEKALEAICDSKQVPSQYKANCKQLMDRYKGQIADWLMEGKDAETICKALGACSAVQVDTGVQLDPCSLCKTAIGGVKKEVKSKSKEAYEKALEAICNSKQVPSQFQAKCKQLMDRYKAQIADWLMEGKDAETICKALGACTAVQVDTADLDDVKCTLCTSVIEIVEKMITGKKSEAAIEEALKKVCSKLSPVLRDGCDGLVSKYGPELVKLLMKEVDPAQICKAIHLCSRIFPIGQVEMGVQIEPCSLCKTAIGGVKKEVKSKSKEAYEKALEAICDSKQVPSQYKANCKQLMDRYKAQIADWLMEGKDAETICKDLGACSAVQVDTGVQIEPCPLCKTVIDGVKKEVKSKTKEAYEKALEAICNSKQVPSQFKEKCKVYIDSYKAQIADWLMEGKDAQTICKQLDLCTAVQVDTADLDDVKCTLCTSLIEIVEKMITGKKSEAAIEEALKKVCSKLSPVLRDGCDGLVSKYGPELVKLLMKEVDPAKICKAIHLCSRIFPIGQVEMASPVSAGMECSVCKTTVGILGNMIRSKGAQEEIEKALEMVCGFLPQRMRAECDAFVKEYTPLVIALLTKELNPDQLCREIDLCKKMATVTAPVEADDNGVTCPVCEVGIELLQGALDEQIVQTYLVSVAHDVCGRVYPAFMVQKCNGDVDSYADPIFSSLKQIAPHQVCKVLKLCEADDATATSLGQTPRQMALLVDSAP